MVMAEESLYGSTNEPKFPFDRLATHLSWLPTRISAAEESRSMEEFLALLQTILVFGRARTSCMNNLGTWKACRELTASLNGALEAVSGEALHHRIELVRRGPFQYFVTCKNSPRFNWKTPLTHIEVGGNLDYFGAGHMFSLPYPPRAHLKFVEQKTMRHLFCEYVALDSLEDDVLREQLTIFNDARQTVLNNGMEKFGLPYRFKWALNGSRERQQIAAVVESSSPPTLKWWEDNCIMVNCAGDASKSCNYQYCNFRRKHFENWLLIQDMYQFSAKYDQEEYHRFIFWEKWCDISRNIEKEIENTKTPEEYESFAFAVRTQ
jgi:hypothetical protein